MELDKLIIQTRVRNPWAAIDLGFKLTKSFWLTCVALYFVLALPVFTVAFYLLDDEYRWCAAVIVWWLKPLFERPLLFLFSRELFQQASGFSHSFRHFRQWWSQGLLAMLTYRRLSACRSMYAPILVLEGANANQYSQRASVLGLSYSSAGMWLTWVLFHFEAFFYSSVMALAALFLPELMESVVDGWFYGEAANSYSEFVFNLLGVLMAVMVAPFYVAGGFMLYISRRIELEGWDIEICFREWLNQNQAHATISSPGQISA